MLESIRIRRFKSVEDVEIPLARITVLVGSNNAGKSSILQGFQFGVSLAQSLALSAGARWSRDSLSGTLSSEQIVYSPMREVQALAMGGSLKQDRQSAIEIDFADSLLGSCEVSVSRGKNKNIAVNVRGASLGERIQRLEQPYAVIAPGLAGIPAFEEYRSPGLVRRAAARGDANSVLRNILFALKGDGRSWAQFQERLAIIFPDVTLDVSFDVASDEHIAVKVSRAGVTLPLDASGTGILQATQVLAYIGLYRPRVLILDEPDSHLHPDNQRKLVHLLQHVAEEDDLQVLFSTHSRHLLDEASRMGALVHWVANGGIRNEGDSDLVRILLDLGALDAGDRIRNGEMDFVVLTEDTNIAYLKAILDSSGFVSNFSIWSYASCSKIDAAEAIGRFVMEQAPSTRVIVHIDRDYRSDDEVREMEERFSRASLLPFVTDGVDIESYFLSEGHLAMVYPSREPEEIHEILKEATELASESCIEKMTNWRVEAANRARRSGGAQPNAGKIATECRKQFNSNPERYRHGKAVLKRVRSIVQERWGDNRSIAQSTSALNIPSLARIAHPEKQRVES